MAKENEINRNAKKREHENHSLQAEIRKLREQNIDRQGEYWSEEERNMLEKMFYECAGISEMAVFFQRSEVAIINQLNLMGMFQKVRRPKEKEHGCRCPGCEFYGNCERKCICKPIS